jgi:hypothetical protein
MPDCNVRWKGYPHRCLPRIRVASSSGTSIRSRRAPRIVSAYKSRLRARHHVQAFGWNTEVASRANASPVSRSPVVDSIEGPRYRTQRSLVSSQALSRCGKRVAPLDGVDSGRSHRTRAYDTRVDPRKLLDRNHPAKSQSTTATTRRAASRPSPKKQCEGNSCLR